MAFKEIVNKRSLGNRVSNLEDYDVLSYYKAGVYISKGEHIQKYHLNLVLSLRTMKSARLIIGDKVKVFFDDQNPNRMMIKRVTEDGFTLSCSNPSANKGRSIRSCLKIPSDPLIVLEYGKKLLAKSELTADGLILNFS